MKQLKQRSTASVKYDYDLTFKFCQRCQQQHHGITDNGLCMQDVIGTVYCWCDPVPAIQQAVQDEEAWMHCHKAPGSNDVQIRSDPYHYYGPSSKGDSRVL